MGVLQVGGGPRSCWSRQSSWETLGLGLCSLVHHSALPEMPTVCSSAPLRFISSTPWIPCPVLVGLLLGVNKTECGTREH